MRSEGHLVVSCLLVLSLCMVVGCGKKPAEDKPQGATPTQGTQSAATQSAPAQAAPAQAAATQTSSLQSSLSQALAGDLQTPVAQLQAAAQAMSVDALKTKALQYKEAIVGKQADVETLLAKVKGLSISDALGEEGKTVKNDLQSLQTTVSELKDRYQVYYNALKEKGADLTGLALTK